MVVVVEVEVIGVVGVEVVGVVVVVVIAFGVVVVIAFGVVVVGELVVAVGVVGEVVVVAVFTRLRLRPYRIHMGSRLEVLFEISGGRVGGEIVVEGVGIEEVESGVVWGVVVVEVEAAPGLLEVIVGSLASSAWCSSQ